MASTQIDDIYEMLVDSQKGYQEAAEIADDPAIARMFADRATERQALMQRFGRNVPAAHTEQGGSVGGAAHRLFINLRRMVQDDTKVALAEVERGEKAFLEAIESALHDGQLSPQDRPIVTDLHQKVLDDHNAFAAMSERY